MNTKISNEKRDKAYFDNFEQIFLIWFQKFTRPAAAALAAIDIAGSPRSRITRIVVENADGMEIVITDFTGVKNETD